MKWKVKPEKGPQNRALAQEIILLQFHSPVHNPGGGYEGGPRNEGRRQKELGDLVRS